jgi:hypothetical protein
MPPIMRFLIVCAFFCHYNSVFAFLDHEDVGVVVLSHLYLNFCNLPKRYEVRFGRELL